MSGTRAPDEDIVELFALYAFANAVTIDLDTADFEWLELHANAVTYARNRDDLPLGAWLREGFKVEIVDQRLVSAKDPRSLRTVEGSVSYTLR
jgi:hypothetical protein